MSNDPLVPPPTAPVVSHALPDPFASHSRFDALRVAVEPLVTEFWSEREPLKAVLVAIQSGWARDPAVYAARCLAAGAELAKADLTAFPAEMAAAVKPGPVPTPEETATQAVWCLLAAGAAGDSNRVNTLLSNLLTRPKVLEEMGEAVADAIDTCLARWRCGVAPRFVGRLRPELDRLGVTVLDAMEWLHGAGADLSPRAHNALRDWLYSLDLGRPIAMTDPAELWGPETPEPLTRVGCIPTRSRKSGSNGRRSKLAGKRSHYAAPHRTGSLCPRSPVPRSRRDRKPRPTHNPRPPRSAVPSGAKGARSSSRP